MTLARYLLRAVAWRVLWLLAGLTAIYVAFALGDRGRLDAATIGWGPLARSTALHLPLVAIQVLPAALLIGGVLALATLRRRGELEAMAAAGLRPRAVAAVLLGVGSLAAGAALVAGELVVPRCEAAADRIERGQRRSPLTGELTRRARWFRRDSWLVRIAPRSSRRDAPLDVIALQLDDHRVVRRIEGRATARSTGLTAARDARLGDAPRERRAQRLRLPALAAIWPAWRQRLQRPEAQAVTQLRRRLAIARRSGAPSTVDALVLQLKLAYPCLNLVAALLAWITVGTPRERALLADLGLAVGWVALLWLLVASGWLAGRGGLVPPAVAAWLPPALAASVAAGAVLARRHGRVAAVVAALLCSPWRSEPRRRGRRE